MQGQSVASLPAPICGAYNHGMEGEYFQEWQELRKLRKRMLILALVLSAGFMPVNLIGWLADKVSPLFGFGWFAICAGLMLRLVFTIGEHTYWACPRCGKSFHEVCGTFGRWVNPFARRCLNCGLPKWVESDPNPNLKLELNPFRTDTIFGLNKR
jgi:hypothetical protein